MSYIYKKMLITNNNPNRKVQKIKALIFHYTGNSNKGANAEANRNFFQNHPNAQASSNFIVDDKTVVEAIPIGYVSYHAGGSSYTNLAKNNFMLNNKVKPNDFAIGYEICNNSDGNWDKAVSNTIELAAKNIIEHKLDNVMLIRHYDVTNKICPKPMVDSTTAWENFKQRILNRVSELKGNTVKPPTIETPNNTYKKATVTAKTGLNMRSGAGTSYQVKRTIPEKAVVKVFSISNNWAEVEYENIKGYCSSEYLKIESTTSDSNSTVKYGIVKVNSSLNVREKASSTSKVIGTLKNGEKIKLANKVGSWWSIYYGTNGGFVHADYISI